MCTLTLAPTLKLNHTLNHVQRSTQTLHEGLTSKDRGDANPSHQTKNT